MVETGPLVMEKKQIHSSSTKRKFHQNYCNIVWFSIWLKFCGIYILVLRNFFTCKYAGYRSSLTIWGSWQIYMPRYILERYIYECLGLGLKNLNYMFYILFGYRFRFFKTFLNLKISTKSDHDNNFSSIKRLENLKWHWKIINFKSLLMWATWSLGLFCYDLNLISTSISFPFFWGGAGCYIVIYIVIMEGIATQ